MLIREPAACKQKTLDRNGNPAASIYAYYSSLLQGCWRLCTTFQHFRPTCIIDANIVVAAVEQARIVVARVLVARVEITSIAIANISIARVGVAHVAVSAVLVANVGLACITRHTVQTGACMQQ